MKTTLLTFFLIFSFYTASFAVVLSIGAPTSDFTLVPGATDVHTDGPNNNEEATLVGDVASGFGSSYIGFDPGTASTTDGTLYLRLRLSGDEVGGQNSAGEFNEYALFGFDVTDNAELNFFIEIDGSANAFNPVISIFDATGGTNNSILSIGPGSAVPGVTLNASTEFALVTTIDGLTGSDADLDSDGGTDALLTLSVDFAGIVAAANATGATGFDDTSAFSLISLVDANGNFNGSNGVSDVAGVDDDNPGTGLFSDGIGISPFIDVNGNTVPEPRAYAMIMGLVAFMGVVLKRRHLRS